MMTTYVLRSFPVIENDPLQQAICSKCALLASFSDGILPVTIRDDSCSAGDVHYFDKPRLFNSAEVLTNVYKSQHLPSRR